MVLLELQEYERDVLYPLATERIPIDLDDGVLVNYNKFGEAIKKVAGLNDKKAGFKTTKIQLFDVYGKLVKSILVDSSVVKITCSDLETGIYIIKVMNPDNSVYRKLLIKN